LRRGRPSRRSCRRASPGTRSPASSMHRNSNGSASRGNSTTRPARP
jgi:hypothetical protein